MRRSLAPSSRGLPSLHQSNGGSGPPSSFKAPFFNRAPPKKEVLVPKSVVVNKIVNENEKRYFTVIWCKMSSRKHKKWEEDALLIVNAANRVAILKTMTGKELSRGGSGMKISELTQLESGSSLSFGGKEIQVMEELSFEEFQSKIESEEKEEGENEKDKIREAQIRPPPPPKKFKPFSIPLSRKNRIMFNADSVEALVLPRPETCTTGSVTDVIVDPHLTRQLRPHQRQGVIFLYQCVMGFRISSDYRGCILADEMGLGKTLQTIALIWTLIKQGPYGKPVAKRILILAPSSLVKNWQSEFQKWLGMERITVFAVDQNSRFGEYIKRPFNPVVIMSYEMFVRCADLLENIKFDLLVCDEGHRLKNGQIKASTLISSLDFPMRIVLTGTPVQNDLREFYSLLSLVNPGILGASLAEFSREYEDPIIRSKQPEASLEEVENGKAAMESLNHKTNGFILRRTQDVISGYLPPKIENVLFCRPSDYQKTIYKRALESLVRNIDFLPSDSVLSSILKLRKICNHPSFLSEEETGDSNLELTFEEQGSKLAVVSCILWTLNQVRTEKIVIVSISTKVLDLIQELCNYYSYPSLRLDGSTSTVNRQSIVQRFNSPYSKDFVLLLSSKAGGTGLNLIGASRILLYDMDWNPAHDIQAMARVWRDGQKKQVAVYRLVTTGTIEEKIFQRQITKQGLGVGVIGKDSQNPNSKFHFTKEDLKDLFSFQDGVDCETHDLLDCPSCLGESPTMKINDNDENDHSRTCQLGLSEGLLSKEKIKDLLKWEHISSQNIKEKISDDQCIISASDFLTFVFRNKVT